MIKYHHIKKVPKGKKFDYKGKWIHMKGKDRYFTGKTTYMKWRILVDKSGKVYYQKLNLKKGRN